MKVITILLSALALGLLPATLGAQATTGEKAHSESVNYYAEFADLMHGEPNAKPAPAATPSANRFSAFVHYREEMKGRAEDFLAYYEKIAAPAVPPANAVFAKWSADCTAFTHRPSEDCSGR